ncbi:NTP transferase domain-containing protein [Parvibaculum sp.]|jgi:choline kinase|uniref:phosphocholine cytidylyltransferase family protein n=1 Tax=Parvibaculum sp. TaxID=2024848 RepID=UPI003C7530A1
MKVIFLAAGQGTRLRPLTDDRPKCMVPFLGKPLIERDIETLRLCGVNDILVIGGYRAEKLEGLGVEIVLNPRFETTNMVQTLFSARAHFPTDTGLIISYGDIVYQPPLVRALIESDAPVSVVIDKDWRDLWERRFDDPLSDAETLRLDETGRLIEIGRKPKSYDEIEGQYIGLIKIRRDHIPVMCDLFDRLDRSATYDGQSFDNMYMTTFIQRMIDTGLDVRAVPVHGGWFEIDSVEDLNVYEEWQRSGTMGNRAVAD